MIFDRSAFQGSYCRLCAVKFFLSNNTLMGIVYNYPVLTVNPNHMGMTDPVTSMLSIDNPANIAFIPQDAVNQTARPKVFLRLITTPSPGAGGSVSDRFEIEAVFRCRPAFRVASG